MADLRISDLVTASQLKDDDYYEISQSESGTRVSYKATLLAIAVQIATVVQLTSDLTTDSKTLAGAINELKQKISLIPKFSIDVVETLPTEDISDTTIYLVPSDDPETENAYDEYINLTGTTSGWEKIGSTDIDMSAYYTKLEVDGLLVDKLEADDFEASQTASANPITLETKQAGLAKSCVVSFGPIQDLHGYDHPWAGGAGKNLIPITVSHLKSVNTLGTWNGNAYTYNGITYTLELDEGENIESITTTGTASADSGLTIVAYGISALSPYLVNGSSYKINGCNGGSASTYSILGQVNGSWYRNTSGDTSFTYQSGGADRIGINIANGYQCPSGGIKFYPMVRLSTVTDATFAPYSNICPISGRTEASVTRTGANLYGGSVFKDELVAQIPTTVVTDNTVAFFAGAINGKIFAANVKYKPNTAYTFRMKCSVTYAGSNTNLRVYYTDETYLDIRDSSQTQANVDRNIVVTTNANKTVKEIRGANQAGTTTVYLDSFGIFEGVRTFDDFESYQEETHTKEFGQTVYGGTLDMTSGKLTIDKKYFTFSSASLYGNYGDDNAPLYYCDIQGDSEIYPAVASNSYKLWSNYFVRTMASDDGKLASGEIRTNNTVVPNTPNRFYFRWDGVSISDINSAFGTTPLQVVGEMQTPTTIQLSPEAVKLLKGLNVISTDGDKVQVEFSDIPVGDYSALLDYIKSLEERIQNLES